MAVPTGTEQAELGTLLAGAVQAVVNAQDVLDDHARRQSEGYLASPPGSLTLPPLWFAFEAVSVDIELSSEVVTSTPGARGARAGPTLLCRTLNPTTVALFGYEASAGTRVRVSLAPQRIVPNAPIVHEEVLPSPT